MATPTVDELIDEAGRTLGNPDANPTEAEYWLACRCAAAEADLARLVEAAHEYAWVALGDRDGVTRTRLAVRLVLREIKEKRDG